MTGILETEVVIVGSGLGGSTLAYGLARGGTNAILVERGTFIHPPEDRLTPIYKTELDSQPVVGGPSKFYGAAMYRLREADFEETETENGRAPAWPLRYADLEPYYCEAERLYRVHGSSDNDPSDPPRSRPWPYRPIPHQGPTVELVSRLATRAGAAVSYIPRAIDYDPANGGACVLCQHCDAYYCPRDAKMDAEIAALRPALKTGRVQVLTETRCLNIIVTPEGNSVSGVRIQNGTEERTIRADTVVLSAGLTETPLLLWRSRNNRHVKGLGNSSGTLGRNMAAHTHAWIFPIVPGVQKTHFHQKTFAINSFYESAPGWPRPCGTIQAAGHLEAWLSCPSPLRRGVGAVMRNSFQVFVMAEALPSTDAGYALSDHGARLLSLPRANRSAVAKLRSLAMDIFKAAGYCVIAPPWTHSDWHPVGTARMGSDPQTSVINMDCCVHDVEGLYVVDASSLPRAGAVNTGLTIAALGLRTADVIQRKLGRAMVNRERDVQSRQGE